MSSSDGWPLIGPEREREPLAVDLGAEDERQQQQRDAGRRPRVLVLAQPEVGPDDDRDRAGEDERERQPDELDLGQAELRAEEALDDEVLRQPLHQQQADPAEQPDRRQQDLVGPPTGEDLGDVHAEQHAEIDHEVERLRRRQPAS